MTKEKISKILDEAAKVAGTDYLEWLKFKEFQNKCTKYGYKIGMEYNLGDVLASEKAMHRVQAFAEKYLANYNE